MLTPPDTLSAQPEYGHIGISRCRHCHKTNPWRSTFQYTVATGTDADHGRNTAVYPGFLGECRHCGATDPQDVIQLSPTLEHATLTADPVNMVTYRG